MTLFHFKLERFSQYIKLLLSLFTVLPLSLTLALSLIDINTALKQAEHLYKLRQWNSALKICRQVLSEDPTNIKARLIIAKIYIQQSMITDEISKNRLLSAAEDILEQVIMWDPHNWEAFYLKGKIASMRGEALKASEYFTKALKYNPKNMSLRVSVARYYYKIKEYSKAEEILRGRKFDVVSTQLSTVIDLLDLLYKLKLYDEFKDNLALAIAKYPDSTDIQYYKALESYMENDYLNAYHILKEIIAAGCRDNDILLLYAKVLLKLGKISAAEKVLEEIDKAYNPVEYDIIKKDIQNIRLMRTARLSIILTIVTLLISIVYTAIVKISISRREKLVQQLSKYYDEEVSMNAQSKEKLGYSLINFYRKYLKLNELVLYIPNPKANRLELLSSSIPPEMLSDIKTLTVFMKYLHNWAERHGNSPATLIQLKNDEDFYRALSGYPISMLSRYNFRLVFPFVASGKLEGLMLARFPRLSMLERAINRIKLEKDTWIKIAEKVANDIRTVRLAEGTMIDSLTRLYNKGYMLEQLSKLIEEAKTTKSFVSIIMFDIDNFKKFNDTYGHQVGDEVLRSVSSVIIAYSRKGIDIPFRYGGEELGIIMPGVDETIAYRTADRIRKAIESTDFPNVPTRITVSGGVATFPKHADNMEDLIHEADEALYVSKRTGKNRVTVAGSTKVLLDSGSTQKAKEREVCQEFQEKMRDVILQASGVLTEPEDVKFKFKPLEDTIPSTESSSTGSKMTEHNFESERSPKSVNLPQDSLQAPSEQDNSDSSETATTDSSPEDKLSLLDMLIENMDEISEGKTSEHSKGSEPEPNSYTQHNVNSKEVAGVTPYQVNLTKSEPEDNSNDTDEIDLLDLLDEELEHSNSTDTTEGVQKLSTSQIEHNPESQNLAIEELVERRDDLISKVNVYKALGITNFKLLKVKILDPTYNLDFISSISGKLKKDEILANLGPGEYLILMEYRSKEEIISLMEEIKANIDGKVYYKILSESEVDSYLKLK